MLLPGSSGSPLCLLLLLLLSYHASARAVPVSQLCGCLYFGSTGRTIYYAPTHASTEVRLKGCRTGGNQTRKKRLHGTASSRGSSSPPWYSIPLHAPYAMSGTDLQYDAISLRTRCVMPGTAIAYQCGYVLRCA
eukprot:1330005-Rhodomonas_salina.3